VRVMQSTTGGFWNTFDHLPEFQMVL